MRKSTIITALVLVVLGAGAFFALSDPMRLLRGGGDIDALAKAFMQDLQFKDFRQSGLYHHQLERGRLDIGRSVERLFLLKPELLDIQDYRIVKSEIDSSGMRGRTLLRVRFKKLNISKEPEDKDIVLYWLKRHPDCPMGGKCATGGQCVDEFDKPLFKPVKKEDEARSENDRLARDSTEEVKASGEPFKCDVTTESRWFMNLDSSLKEKGYDNASAE